MSSTGQTTMAAAIEELKAKRAELQAGGGESATKNNTRWASERPESA